MHKKIIGKISIFIILFIVVVICLVKMTKAASITLNGNTIKDTYELGQYALYNPAEFMSANIPNDYISSNGNEIKLRNRSMFISQTRKS